MAWIELHQTLPRHPKLLRLAGRLRIHPAQAAGHLTFLWLWTLDYAPTGDLSAFGPAEISAAACFPGDAEQFHRSLMETGWLDEDGQVHDWMEYAGCLIQQRAKDKERKRKSRGTKSPEDDQPPSSGNPNAVQRTSGGHPSDGGRTADVPNPTQPNPTVEEHTPRGRDDLPVEMPPGFPKSETEAKAASAAIGCPEKFAVEEYHRAMGRGGRDGRDVPVRSWASYLRTCWTHHQSRKAEEASRLPRTASNFRRTIGTSTPDDAKF